MTCSPERNDELFRMTLAGCGQCGIIAPARLRRLQRPVRLVHPLLYDDMDAFSPIEGASQRRSMRSARSMAASPRTSRALAVRAACRIGCRGYG